MAGRMHVYGLVLALACLPGCTISFGNHDESVAAAAESTEQQKLAARAALALAEQVDRAEYAQLWRGCGNWFHENSNETTFTTTMRLTRAMVDRPLPRDAARIGYYSRLEKLPEGRYAIVEFDSRQGKVLVTEKVVMSHEDEQWRLVGYHIRKSATSG